MTTDGSLLVLDPARVFSLALPRLDGPLRRATLRSVLALSAGAVRVEGAERAASAPAPTIFALTHHNAWEAVLAPAALIALRGGSLVRFLVDWMFVDLPWTGWLVGQARPIPVYGKSARFGLRDGHRRARRRRDSAFERALAALAAGDDVGIYPEGRRNADPWRLLPGRRGLGRLALRSGAPVLPIGVDFPARDRLRRTPRLGRFVLRVGEPLRFEAERSAWLAAADARQEPELERRLAGAIDDRVLVELARLSRKIYTPRSTAPMAGNCGAPVRAAQVRAEKVLDAATRAEALTLLAEVYREEKGWLREVGAEIAPDPAAEAGESWFLVRCAGEPAGLVRLHYDPPLELPAHAGVELEPGVDLGALAAAGRFVEVGRLMIRPAHRGRPAVVLELMRAALAEIVERGYTHLFTAVFEDDPHSPYRFHTRVLGFERIGTHRRGELSCASRRILLVLDLARGAERLRARSARLLADLAGGVEERLRERARPVSPSPARDTAAAEA